MVELDYMPYMAIKILVFCRRKVDADEGYEGGRGKIRKLDNFHFRRPHA